MTVLYRLRQVIHYLLAQHQRAPAIPQAAKALLSEPMEHQFRILSPGDQRHLIEVHRELRERGADHETLIAGLIHDVGKACRKCHISLLDRGAHVILNAMLPGPYRWFARRQQVPSALMGLHLLATHASRGALAAEQAGYSERVCWLVLHHQSGGDPADPQLQLLRDVDKAIGSWPSGNLQ